METGLLATLIALSAATSGMDAPAPKADPTVWQGNVLVLPRPFGSGSAEAERSNTWVDTPWLSQSATVSNTTPIKSAAGLRVATVGASPADLVMSRTVARAVSTGQKDTPQPDLEVLPKPTPVRMPPADNPLSPGVVSSTVYVDTTIPEVTGLVSVQAEPVLWLIPNSRPLTSLAVPDAIGAAPSGRFDTLGDEHVNKHMVPGGRVALGYWWTTDNPWVPGGKLPTLGVETRFMFVGERSVSFTDDRSPTLVRPFFNLNTGQQSGVVVATPGLATGFLSATASERMWGNETNLWTNVHFDWPGTTYSIEAMAGVRYLELNEGIQIARSSQFVPNPVGFPDFAFLAGNRITEQESLSSQNRFIGGQVGVRANLMFDNAILTTQLQLAAGDTNEQINIQGTQRRTLPTGQSIVSQGALFALPSNIGRHSQNEFALMPEIGVKLSFPINNHLTLGAAFSTLYWSRIARPGEQVDRSVDVTQIPSFPGAAAAIPTGLARPGVPFNQTDMWLMGVMVTAEFKW